MSNDFLPGENYVVMSVTDDENGQVIGTLTNGNTCINGLQIAEVPEPATMVLLGMGSLVSLRRRKK